MREVAGDIFGSLTGSSSHTDNFMARFPYKRRRKRAKRSKRLSSSRKRKHRRKRRKIEHRKTYRRQKKVRGKRRGMSAAFLRNLRRKHHLGEFKKS